MVIRTANQGSDLVNVVLVVGLAVVGNAELSIGGIGGAVTVGQVVDDDLEELLVARALAKGGGVGEVSAEIGDLGDGVFTGRVRSNSEEVNPRLNLPSHVKVGMFATVAAFAARVGSEICGTAAWISAA